MAKQILTAERLREVLNYNPETGAFTRRWIVGSSVKVGVQAGAIEPSGYRKIVVDEGKHFAHRLAWLHVTGAWPEHCIDHINGIKSDNRFVNLRDVQHAINVQNRRKVKTGSSSGILGVSPTGRVANPWRAVIGLNGSKFCLGSFPTQELAYAAYIEAKRRLHPGCTI